MSRAIRNTANRITHEAMKSLYQAVDYSKIELRIMEKTRYFGWLRRQKVPRFKTEIAQAILNERSRQDSIWGGASHDDEHDADEWEGFIRQYTKKATEKDEEGRVDVDQFIHRMEQAAALAVAAIESAERAKADPERALSSWKVHREGGKDGTGEPET